MADDPYYSITVREEPSGVIALRLSGDLDINARDELRDQSLAAIATVASAGRRIVLDFTDTAFLDSEALAGLIEGLNAAREADVEVDALNARGMVRRVLEVAGVLELFDSVS